MTGYDITFIDNVGAQVCRFECEYSESIHDSEIFKQFSGFIGCSYPEMEGVNSVGPITSMIIVRRDEVATTLTPPV